MSEFQYGFVVFYRKNGELTQPYPLCVGETTIGSHQHCDIRLKKVDSLETKHCTIKVEKSGLATLINHSTVNPVSLNGKQITNSVQLKHKDVIEVLQKRFLYSNELLTLKDNTPIRTPASRRALQHIPANSPNLRIKTPKLASLAEKAKTPKEKTPKTTPKVQSNAKSANKRSMHFQETATTSAEKLPDCSNISPGTLQKFNNRSAKKAHTSSKVIVSKALGAPILSNARKRLSLGSALPFNNSPKSLISSKNLSVSALLKAATPKNTPDKKVHTPVSTRPKRTPKTPARFQDSIIDSPFISKLVGNVITPSNLSNSNYSFISEGSTSVTKSGKRNQFSSPAGRIAKIMKNNLEQSVSTSMITQVDDNSPAQLSFLKTPRSSAKKSTKPKTPLSAKTVSNQSTPKNTALSKSLFKTPTSLLKSSKKRKSLIVIEESIIDVTPMTTRVPKKALNNTNDSSVISISDSVSVINLDSTTPGSNTTTFKNKSSLSKTPAINNSSRKNDSNNSHGDTPCSDSFYEDDEILMSSQDTSRFSELFANSYRNVSSKQETPHGNNNNGSKRLSNEPVVTGLTPENNTRSSRSLNKSQTHKLNKTASEENASSQETVYPSDTESSLSELSKTTGKVSTNSTQYSRFSRRLSKSQSQHSLESPSDTNESSLIVNNASSSSYDSSITSSCSSLNLFEDTPNRQSLNNSTPNNKNKEVFKTPLNTPAVFEQLRNSALKSRKLNSLRKSASNVSSLSNEAGVAQNKGVKRLRDSSTPMSLLKAGKKQKINDEFDVHRTLDFDSSLSSESMSDLEDNSLNCSDVFAKSIKDLEKKPLLFASSRRFSLPSKLSTTDQDSVASRTNRSRRSLAVLTKGVISSTSEDSDKLSHDNKPSESIKRTSNRTSNSPLTDMSEVRGLKKLLGTPKAVKSPLNDLSDVRDVKKLLRTPKQQKSPKNDLTKIYGVKKLLATPKVAKSPRNDLTNIIGVKKLMATPKPLRSPKNDLTDVKGVKRLLRTPKHQRSPKNDLTDVGGVKKMFRTPKQQKSPKNDLTNVAGVKKLLGTPKVTKSPRNDLTNIIGVKKLMATPKQLRSPRNDLSDVKGVKRMFSTPKETKSPRNDLTDVGGVKKLLRTPREMKPPRNELTDFLGMKKIFRTPKQQKEPVNDLSDVEGVATLFQTDLDDIENTDLFGALFDKKPIRQYRPKSTSPYKTFKDNYTNRKTLGDLPLNSPEVSKWVEAQSRYVQVEKELPKNIFESPKHLEKQIDSTNEDTSEDKPIGRTRRAVVTKAKAKTTPPKAKATRSRAKKNLQVQEPDSTSNDLEMQSIEPVIEEPVKVPVKRTRKGKKTQESPKEPEVPLTRSKRVKKESLTEVLDSRDIEVPAPRRRGKKTQESPIEVPVTRPKRVKKELSIEVPDYQAVENLEVPPPRRRGKKIQEPLEKEAPDSEVVEVPRATRRVKNVQETAAKEEVLTRSRRGKKTSNLAEPPEDREVVLTKSVRGGKKVNKKVTFDVELQEDKIQESPVKPKPRVKSVKNKDNIVEENLPKPAKRGKAAPTETEEVITTKRVTRSRAK